MQGAERSPFLLSCGVCVGLEQIVDGPQDMLAFGVGQLVDLVEASNEAKAGSQVGNV